MLTQLKIKKSQKRNDFSKIIFQGREILKEFYLCDNCTGRLFAKNLGVSSHKLLGKKIKKSLKISTKSKCFICKDLFHNIHNYVKQLEDSSSNYSFSTFLLGAKLKPSITDRDDQIRSKFKLRGIDSVKTDLTHQIGQKFAKKTQTKVDYLRPEVTFTLNFKEESCEVKIRPIILFGKYSKTQRGTPQKQTRCHDCLGRGCYSCDYHGLSGYDSVEGKIAKFLFKKFGGTSIKINWIGGEDKDSLVLGTGRPFFVKLLNPNLRKLRLGKRYSMNGIEIKELKIIDRIPKTPPQFKTKVDLSIHLEDKLILNNLKSLKKLKNKSITIYENRKKQNKKFIHDIKYRRNSPNSISLKLVSDGGLPLRRFVEGNNIEPNISEILGTKCKCEKFDFQEINLLNSRYLVT